MRIEYAQTDYICTKGERDNDALLREEMKKALITLQSAYSGFDNVTDPDLIDCYIFQVNSALKRYRYLLNQARILHPMEEEEGTNPDNTDSKPQKLIALNIPC